MSKNEIIGDEIKSKVNSKQYDENYDRIFRKDWPEEDRINTIGQNGNSGEHYDSLCEVCGKSLFFTQECAWTSCPLLFAETTTIRRD